MSNDKPKYDPEVIGFTPSEYQVKFFDFITEGKGNAVISATAGSGKTTSVVAAMKLIPKNKRCIFLAFNKSIAQELTERLKDYPNCKARTCHSLGLQMIYRNLGGDFETDEYKYRTYVKKNLAELSSLEGVPMSKQDINDYVEAIISLIDFGRFNLAQTTADLERIAEKYGVVINYDEAEIALKCMQWGRDHTETIDFTDMLWLPVERGMSPMGNQYDWVFIDECQDQSLLSIEVFKKCFKRGTRFVSVGDEKQAINGFAGSSPEAFQAMCNYPNTTMLELPISYRCASKIVELANKFVPSMQARPGAAEGAVVHDCRLRDVRDGDMILARIKAPLFDIYNMLLHKGVNCYIKGADIGKNIINILDTIDEKELNKDLKKDGVFVRLYEKMFNKRNDLMKRRGLDLKDATFSAAVMELYDIASSLETLSGGLKTKVQLINKIRSVFQDDARGVCLSTIHKSKGLEADNVYIANSSAMPSKRAEQDWEKAQEQNLMYVAYTRAKKKLGFLSEKEVPPSGEGKDEMSILNDMRYIEHRVCEVLGTTPVNPLENDELARFRMQTTEPIDVNKYLEENGINVQELFNNVKDTELPTVEDLRRNARKGRDLFADLEEFSKIGK